MTRDPDTPAASARRLGGLVLAFAFSPRPAAAQAAGLPGSLAKQPHAGRLAAHGGRRIGDDLRRQGRARAGHPDRPRGRSPPRSSTCRSPASPSSPATPARTPDEGHTAGSQSIEYGGTAIRLACAEARALLLDQAARKLGVAADTLERRRRRGRRARRAQGGLWRTRRLRSTCTARRPPRWRPSRPPARHRRPIDPAPGHSLPRSPAGPPIVQDIRLPGMTHGRVVRPPRYGARLESVDEAAARAMPGVLAVVRDGSFLGVVAEREEQAIKARTALVGSRQMDWRHGNAGTRPACSTI